jgi:hypothetical protein
MEPLDRTHRAKLEKAVQDAREIAEVAAKSSLDQLGVSDASPPHFLTDKCRELRRQLRSHARQLGDIRNPKTEIQEIDLLVEEVAYEHWHRMLFARFLAENDLLMYPGPPPVAITLDECEELATEQGAKDGWELASQFAARMLPQIFRPESPVFKLQLAPEHAQNLESLVTALPNDVFTASDSLGWIYQFWQSKRKEEVNISSVKIGPRELPAVTQLFTEPYMVSFLLDNSLGAWWSMRRLRRDDLKNGTSEEELRTRAAIPGVPLKYLRFVRKDEDAWCPAAGSFDEWPDILSELKTLDPCCGSGHFLVAAFLMLVPMRMELEGLSSREAVDRVLAENIQGLELDKRCVELAAFALAFTAWRYPDAGGYRPLPELNVACSGLSINAKKEDWMALAGENGSLSFPLENLYSLFNDASLLGSLIDPSCQKEDSLFRVDTSRFLTALTTIMAEETKDEETEIGVVARGIAHAASMLSQQHHLVFTNVPYLKRSKQNQTLKDFCKRHHFDAKEDLATVFLDRCMSLCASGGTACVVLPQNWLFLTSYQQFRERLLKSHQWNLIARLGPKAFQTQMWDFNVQLLMITCGLKEDSAGCVLSGIDVSCYQNFLEKESHIASEPLVHIAQHRQLENPDCVVQFEQTESGIRLSQYANSYQGSGLADIARFRCFFWEIMPFAPAWVLHQSSPSGTGEYSGLKFITLWENGKGELARSPQVTIRGRKAWNKKGVACAWMGNLPVSLYGGWLYDNSAAVIVPDSENYLPPVWCFCSSPSFNEEVRRINQKLQVANATMVKVPFDIAYWTKVAEEKYPNGLPRPYSDDPTQWIFHGHPCGSVTWNEEEKSPSCGALRIDATVLQVAVARLLGYRWPPELDSAMELSEEQRYWVQRCDEIVAHADEDGIVCIPPVRGEGGASDRLHNLLAIAYGASWNSDRLTELLRHADHVDKSLDSWLRDKFFTQHCQLFQHRPFIWHIWDGLRDGFAALVNYHKLDTKLLQTLIYTYLGDWISRQRQDVSNGVDGAHEKLAAAEQLKKRLELILEGDAPCDIFVRWKSLEQQPIGWNPDPNDGVRLNIRPFLSVSDVGKRGAGILRDKPNINWNHDRGNDLEVAPWYQLFKGERINDHHLSLVEKHAARSGDKLEVYS